ncbi:MAG: hypothetical protein KF716_34665 [Anaerolineae bacterium]|nr:hypothetical protein [Anaerolineae bacterium]
MTTNLRFLDEFLKHYQHRAALTYGDHALASLLATLDQLTADVASQKQSLEAALFALQSWLDANAPSLSPSDRTEFSQVLVQEKKNRTEGQSDDTTLIASVLRLHAMRLLFRFDAQQAEPLKPEDDTAYAQAKYRLKVSLREVETAVNEARIDTAIANAHHILGDRGANRRWLQDALIRIQTAAAKDLHRLAESIPQPDTPPLTFWQRIMFRIYGIRQEEIAKRTVASLRQIVDLQNAQMTEMATLLAESFNAIDDKLGAQQALGILGQLTTKQ